MSTLSSITEALEASHRNFSGGDQAVHELAELTAGDRLTYVQHPLGFWMTELGDDLVTSGAGRLRVHVWPSEYNELSDQRGEIHSHTWELHSAVLAGRITNAVYDIADGGQFDLAEVLYQSAGTALNIVRRGVQPVVRKVDEIPSGRIYAEPSGSYHRSSVAQAPAVTLVLAVPKSTTAYLLVPTDGIETFQERERPVVDSRRVLAAMKPVLG